MGLDKCPKCGSDFGYYIKYIETRSIFYEWNGTPIGGSEPDNVREPKLYHCMNCHKAIGRIQEQ